jgi:hypothetical protein
MASTDCQSANCVMGVCQPAAMSGLKVQYAAMIPLAPNDIYLQPTFNIVNAGATAVPYSELKIRYWYTADTGSAPAFHCYSATGPGGCTFVNATFVTVSPARTNADRYVEIGFTGTATVAASGQSDLLQTAIDKADNFDETNDYSYDPTKMYPTFADWTHVTLYRNGTLVWGTEPP